MKDPEHVNPDLHVSIGRELKTELMTYYPEWGELSKLVKNLLMAVLVQLREDVPINADQIARVTVDTERRRGLREPKRSSGEKTE